MALDTEETRPWTEQVVADDRPYRRQVARLFERSPFYRAKFVEAGFTDADAVGGLDRIGRLPLTDKDELRRTRSTDRPMGDQLAVAPGEIARIYSTSGTTGTPSYIPLTSGDLARWRAISARSYVTAGVRPGSTVATTYNAGPFVAGVALEALDSVGVRHIPLGNANTAKLLDVIEALQPDTLVTTPSYALHIAERAADQGVDLRQASVRQVVVAGEPGGGEPAMRARLETAWGAKVNEVMGIGDIAVSLWGECEHQTGMHFSGHGLVHFELIDPESGAPLPIEDGAAGELVLTHLDHEAAPLFRFRTRDHVRFAFGDCACGRTAPRVRCIGRTDDMLIVRGVNLFPSAVQNIVNEFGDEVSGVIAIRPRQRGTRQKPPLPLLVETAPGYNGDTALAGRIERRIREALVATVKVELVSAGALPRSDYKSALVDMSEAET